MSLGYPACASAIWPVAPSNPSCTPSESEIIAQWLSKQPGGDAAAVPELEHGFIATMEHRVLGTRYVYDGLKDERFLTVLAGVGAGGLV